MTKENPQSKQVQSAWTRREFVRSILAGTLGASAVSLAGCGGGSNSGPSGGGGGGGSNGPALSVVSPSHVMAVLPQTPFLNVYGSNFTTESVVTINDASISTAFVSQTQLQATPTSAQLPSLGTYSIKVVSGSSTSNSIPFVMYSPTEGPQPFTALPAYLVGGQLLSGAIAVADINGDGREDIIMTGPNGSIALLLGQANGSLSEPTFIQGVPAESIAVGDVNGDGAIDIIAATYPADSTGSTSSFTVLHNDGKGNFTRGQTLVFNAAYPSHAVLADFLGTGRNDLLLLVLLNTNSALFLFPNQGNGTFGPPMTIATISGLVSVVVADFNADHKSDIAYAKVNGIPGTHLLVNQGGGAFTDMVPSTLSNVAGNLVVGDFNGDGLVDLAVSSTDSFAPCTLQVFWNQGSNNFLAGPVTTVAPAGLGATPFVAADFDHDGIVDLAAGGNDAVAPTSMFFLWGDGKGNFTRQNVVGPAGGVAAGDFNGDGIPDIVSPDLLTIAATVVLGNAAHSFSQPPFLLPEMAVGISAGDVDGDGYPDLFFPGDPVSQTPGSVFINQRDGTFSLAGRPSYWGISLADLNGDGKAELFGWEGRTYMIWPGNGDPNFGAAPVSIPVPAGALSVGGVLFADLDGDGLAELIGDSFIGWNQGNFQFQFQILECNGIFAIGDVNNDGKLDLVTGGGTFINKGNRQFTQILDNGLPINSGVVVGLGDFNGDHILDAAMGLPLQNPGTVLVAYGRGDGTFYIQSELNGTMTFAGTSNVANLVVADFNGDGLADILTPLEMSTSVLLYTSDGKGGFQTSYFASGTECAGIVVGDFKRNAKPGVVIVNFQPLNPPNYSVVLLPK